MDSPLCCSILLGQKFVFSLMYCSTVDFDDFLQSSLLQYIDRLIDINTVHRLACFFFFH